jgi:hypothetical protein
MIFFSGQHELQAQTTLVPVTPDCVYASYRLSGVDYRIILGLIKTEGGHVGQAVRNTNGSYDLGPMQVNDQIWVHRLANAHFGGNTDTAYRMLRDNGCYNVFIGGWIFSKYLQETKGDYAEAVGFYNSHTPVHKIAYQHRFAHSFEWLAQHFPSLMGFTPSQ